MARRSKPSSSIFTSLAASLEALSPAFAAAWAGAALLVRLAVSVPEELPVVQLPVISSPLTVPLIDTLPPLPTDAEKENCPLDLSNLPSETLPPPMTLWIDPVTVPSSWRMRVSVMGMPPGGTPSPLPVAWPTQVPVNASSLATCSVLAPSDFSSFLASSPFAASFFSSFFSSFLSSFLGSSFFHSSSSLLGAHGFFTSARSGTA